MSRAYYDDRASRVLYTAVLVLCLINCVLWKLYSESPGMAFVWAMVAFFCAVFLRRNRR